MNKNFEFTEEQIRERRRPQILLNLLPPDVAANQENEVFYPIYTYYYDRDQFNLDKFNMKFTLPKRDKMKRFAGKINILKKKENSFLAPEAELMEINKSGHPIEFEPFSIGKGGLYSTGCLTCGQKNLEIIGYGQRHVCLNCRKNIRTYDQDPVAIFLDANDRAVCLGIQIEKDGTQKYYPVGYDQIKIFQHRCEVLVTENSELVILLHDKQNILNQFDQIYNMWASRDPPQVDRNYQFQKTENKTKYNQMPSISDSKILQNSNSNSHQMSSMQKSNISSSNNLILQKVSDSFSKPILQSSTFYKEMQDQNSCDKVVVKDLVNKELQFSFSNVFPNNNNKGDTQGEPIYIQHNEEIKPGPKMSKRAMTANKFNTRMSIEDKIKIQQMEKQRQKLLQEMEKEHQQHKEKKNFHLLHKMTSLWQQ